MAFVCPFSTKGNVNDPTTFILCKKKMVEGKDYKPITEQATVMCEYQYWCAQAHTRKIEEKGRACKRFLEKQ